MTDFRTEGALTLLSSMSHGGDRAGTISYLRREKIVQSDGAVVDVPIISGNSLRGVLRDHSARILWDTLGRPALGMAVFDLLWSGGALAKAGSSSVLSSQQLAQLRTLVPHVSIFGGSGAGRIIEGKLRVGKMVPVCRETAHIVPAGLVDGRDLPSVWDLLQIEEFSRQDDAKRDALLPAASSSDAQGALIEMGKRETAQQMRYGTETIAAGTTLHWWCSLRGVTDLEASCFGRAIGAWVADGAHLGGRSATGHGRLSAHALGWQRQLPQITTGDARLDDVPTMLDEHVKANRDDILEALAWFG